MKMLMFIVLLSANFSVSAEIIKYKSETGNWAYSDVPPPPTIKQEVIGKRKTVPIGVAPLATAASVDIRKIGKSKEVNSKDLDSEIAALKRQKIAEQEKHNKEVADEQVKLKADNCKAARANLAAYTQGGRIYKTNDKGNRDYLDDKALDAGKVQTQQDVEANCS
ncbi:MAG: DUF4124 domain-containing protein [Methylophilaceae bacterium]|nr:DUF4124 domain-containing protein [Methylophilaceae bacterium]